MQLRNLEIKVNDVRRRVAGFFFGRVERVANYKRHEEQRRFYSIHADNITKILLSESMPHRFLFFLFKINMFTTISLIGLLRCRPYAENNVRRRGSRLIS